MAHYLDMTKRQRVLAYLTLGWSHRRIAREVGVDRDTVRRYAAQAAANPAKVFAGSPAVAPSPGSRSGAAVHDALIRERLERGLTAQRIWQDLVETTGYGGSYESVKRYVRRVELRAARAIGVMHHAPGEEAQVDFFRGAPTHDPTTGRQRPTWCFRMTLAHSRHGYEEAVWQLDLPTFLRLHEHAFRDFGGVPKVIRHDNLKAAVTRACLFDPDTNAVYAAFAQHWGFVPLPTQPRHPEENGKEERAGGYVKSNALRGRTFDSLAAQNAHLRSWNETWARQRIHGTTKRQVWAHFVATERAVRRPCPAQAFALFACGTRTVHRDGHVEVAGAF